MARILIVDDEKEITEMFRKFLTKDGHQVITANSGEEGLRLARREKPELILLDVNMPVMDGGHVAQELRESDLTKDIPIVFLTGMVTEKEAIESRGVIANRSFISKFSEPDQIIYRIKESLPSGK